MCRFLEFRILFALAVVSFSWAAQTHYDVLGISRSAAVEDVRKAYKELAKKYHPDKNKGDATAQDKFVRISEAHEVLSDPDKRREYDWSLQDDGHRRGYGHHHNPNNFQTRFPGGESQTFVFTMNGRQYVYTQNFNQHPNSNPFHNGFNQGHFRQEQDWAFRRPPTLFSILLSLFASLLETLFMPMLTFGLLFYLYYTLTAQNETTREESTPEVTQTDTDTRTKPNTTLSIGCHARSSKGVVCVCLTKRALEVAKQLQKAFPDVKFFTAASTPELWKEWMMRVMDEAHEDGDERPELELNPNDVECFALLRRGTCFSYITSQDVASSYTSHLESCISSWLERCLDGTQRCVDVPEDMLSEICT